METFDWQAWVILPALVFIARLIDVALGTVRIIFTSRGTKHLAPLLGFVEVFIWVSIIAQITKGANNIVSYLAYAAGFAAGNYLGMYIENKLAIGTLVGEPKCVLHRGGAAFRRTWHLQPQCPDGNTLWHVLPAQVEINLR